MTTPPRKHGSQMLDFDDGPFSEAVKEGARQALATPLARAAQSALLVVAEQHGVGECDTDECWFPLCLSQGCEGEPVRADAPEPSPVVTRRETVHPDGGAVGSETIEPPPVLRLEAGAVDRSAITTLHGTPVDEVRRQHAAQTTGMHADYIVLTDEERAKGFVRPVRDSYIHEKCGAKTTMGRRLAETYARDPKFYGATFCCRCDGHFPVGADGEFVWDGTNEKVGT